MCLASPTTFTSSRWTTSTARRSLCQTAASTSTPNWPTSSRQSTLLEYSRVQVSTDATLSCRLGKGWDTQGTLSCTYIFVQVRQGCRRSGEISNGTLFWKCRTFLSVLYNAYLCTNRVSYTLLYNVLSHFNYTKIKLSYK